MRLTRMPARSNLASCFCTSLTGISNALVILALD
jgi:hypothetical protein